MSSTRLMAYLVCASLTLLVAALAGTASAEPLEITAAWVRATPPGARTAAAYLTIANRGPTDRLLGAASPAARELQLHTEVAAGQIQAMAPVDAIELPAGGTVRLEPGGMHIMLVDIAARLEPGTAIEVSLRFANAAPVTITVPVVDARAPAHEHH
jgi:copper(I)-binding protein